MIEPMDVPQVMGCLAPGPGSWLHALSILGFVLASRAITKPAA